MKILQVGAELLNAVWRGGSNGWTDERTDGQTETTKLIVAFRNFANSPTNQSF